MCQTWKEGYLYVLFAFFKLSFFTNSIMCLRQITECQGCYDLGHSTALCYTVKSSPAETENGSPCCPFVSEAAFQFGKEILFPPMSSPPRFKRFASPKTKNKPTVGRPQKFQKTLNENSSCEWNGFANCTGCLGFWQEYSKICCSRIWREQQKEKGKLWPSGWAPAGLEPLLSVHPSTASVPIWLRLRKLRLQSQHEAMDEGSPSFTELNCVLSWDRDNLVSNMQIQLWHLALESWGAEATFQAHQKCLCYSSNGSADCCGCQVFDGMDFGCKSNI